MCDEETYRVTPKGIAWLCLKLVGLLDTHQEGKFNAFWILFEEYMREAGYIVEE